MWYEVISDGVLICSQGFTPGKASIQIVPKGKLTLALHYNGSVEAKTREIEVAAGEEKEIVIQDDP